MINKETITIKEFKAWLTGLVVGKGGALPDLDDWKMIKQMIDKVEEEPAPVLQPAIVPPTYPSYPTPVCPSPPMQPQWTPNTDPYQPGYPNWGTWCGDTTSITIGGCVGESVTAEGLSYTYSQNFSDTFQMNLDLGDQITTEMTSGYVQVVDEQSKKLGEELQKMIDEVENGQKESS